MTSTFLPGNRFIDAPVTEFANNDIHTDRFRDALTEFANNDIDTDNFLDALAEFAHSCTKMNNRQDYKLKLQHIIGKFGSKNKPNLAIKKSKKEMEPQENNNPKVESPPDNNNDNDNDIPAIGTSTTPLLVQIIREIKGSDNYGKMLLATIGTGSVPVFLQLIRDIKFSLSNNSLTSKDIKPQTLAPQLPLAEETTYLADQNMTTTYINETKPKMKLTYQVLNEGEGETMTKYRQGCFQYKEAGSVEDISFQGSPTELAIKLCPGFEEAMLEAIVGMKSNGRRIIFIPHEGYFR
ncbi:hypothetical protein ACFE04_026339 [Oxalis oulophora]